MKVQMVKIDSQYNQFGCGYRLLFLIIYKRKRWIQFEEDRSSLHLNRGLNKLVEYWNYHGNANGRDLIKKKEMFVPIDLLEGVNDEDCKAINTKHYGYRRDEQ
jgi:hypothetical protein